MKKLLLLLVPAILMFQDIYSQTTEQPGKPITEIFTDFHLNLSKNNINTGTDTSRTTGFAINRAYFGYQYMPGGNFTARLVLNIGVPEDLAPGAKPKRYSFFRDASLSWSDGKLTLTGGITGTKMFSFQQNYWGKRYIANTYQSLNGYGPVADIGVVAEYKFSDLVSVDYALMNGEGYTDIQLDNSLKNSLGITVTPGKFTLRLYSEVQQVKRLWHPLAIGFVGFKNDRVTLGCEGSFKANSDSLGHHMWGISTTNSFSITKRTEIFFRCDYSTSVKTKGSSDPWNIKKDWTFFVTGFQVTFNKYVKLALDYQNQSPHMAGKKDSGMIFVNGLFKF
jgi:hypothetical protein